MDEEPLAHEAPLADEEPLAEVVVLAPDGEPERPVLPREARFHRRALSGLLVLTLAVGALVMLNRTAAQRIPGAAMPDWPEPPAVGSCVDLLSGVGGTAVVPCSEPHDAEVTKAYSALDPVLAASPSASIDAACTSAMGAYVGPDAVVGDGAVEGVAGGSGGTAADGSGDSGAAAGGGLHPIGLQASAAPVSAPQDQRVGGRGWLVCVVMPTTRVRYLGTVRQVTASGVPDAYRLCWGADGASELVSCTLPHSSEVLASAVFPAVPLLFAHADEPGAPVPDGYWSGTVSSLPPGDVALVPRSGGGAVPSGSGPAAADLASDSDEQLAQLEAERALAAAKAAAESGMGELGDRLVQWQRDVAEQCHAQAATIMRRPDPTFAGTLMVGVEPDPADGSVGIFSVTTGRPASGSTSGSAPDSAPVGQPYSVGSGVSFPQVLYCAVSAPEGRQLTRSLVGWGGQPPPLTAGR